jgi:hypothetical protein
LFVELFELLLLLPALPEPLPVLALELSSELSDPPMILFMVSLTSSLLQAGANAPVTPSAKAIIAANNFLLFIANYPELKLKLISFTIFVLPAFIISVELILFIGLILPTNFIISTERKPFTI